MPFILKPLDQSAETRCRHLQCTVTYACIEMTNLPDMLSENWKVDIKIMDAAQNTKDLFDGIKALLEW